MKILDAKIAAEKARAAFKEAGLGIVVTKKRDFEAHSDFYEASCDGTLVRAWSEDHAVLRLAYTILGEVPA